MLNMKIYHYTNIETLALILSNKTIRFNRLDNVDDLEEGNLKSNGVLFSNYTFVSCWTENPEESIPLWKLYTKGNNGVRICLEKDGMFKQYTLPSDNKYGITPIPPHEMKYDFPIEEIFEQREYQLPIHLDYNSSNHGSFYRKIQYVENIESIAADALKGIKDKEGNPVGTLIAFNPLGTYKHKRWKFEEESRFVLNLLPGNPMAYSLNDMNEGLESMVTNLSNNKNLPFKYYDKELRDDIFEDLEITLNPMIDESQRIILNALCDKFAPNAIIKESDLKGKVYLK